MSDAKRPFFKRLFSFKNIIALVAIAAAILAIPDWSATQLQKALGITEQKVVLILLGLLAVDVLVERIGLLENVEFGLRNISQKLPESALTFRKRGQLSDLPERISGARELFISGLTFQDICMRADLLAQLLQEGCNIKILAVHSDSQAIHYVATIDPSIASMTSPEKALADRIDDHLGSMYRICSQQPIPKGTLEIRTLDYVPPFVFFGIDCSKKTKRVGNLKVELLAHAPHGERPHIELREDHDDKWYRFFLNQFERFWNRGSEWTPRT